MNERIQELANRATSYCDTLDVADQIIYQDIWKREFAELIVRECGNVAWKFGSEFINNQIKNHFGVEN